MNVCWSKLQSDWIEWRLSDQSESAAVVADLGELLPAIIRGIDRGDELLKIVCGNGIVVAL